METNPRALLIIMDGWGHGVHRKADAIALANIPFINSLYRKYPNSELVTFGEQVGLPEGQMGNSEVGHLNIGAGRIVYQELPRITKAIKDGELQKNPVLVSAFQYAKDQNKPVHFIGLVSDGGVHSHINHLLALTDYAQAAGLHGFVHAFTDGRDCDPKSGKGFIKTLHDHLNGKNIKLASIIGRYYAMDRDKRWERVKLAYDLLVNGTGEANTDAQAAIQKQYDQNITDEFLKPVVVDPAGKIQDGDLVICFNFRTDRPREITEVLTQQDHPDQGMHKLNLRYVCMTRYDHNFKNVDVIFENDDLKNTIGETMSAAGKTQVRIAETEKYPHVTFFFSGGREKPFDGERRLMIPSPKVATYDLQPDMSAAGITDAIIEDINKNQPDLIVLNYANTDMVGHTGVFEAAMKAAETVDACVKRLLDVALAHDYGGLIIADHGNSDHELNDDDSSNTQHSVNMVPCFYFSKHAEGKKLKNGKLADVAPTLLAILGMEKPGDMTGENLIEG